MTALLATILGHTPIWVWALLAVLVGLGLLQTRTRDVSPLRLWLVPALVAVAALWSVVQGFTGVSDGVLVVAWAVGVVLGVASNRSLNLPRRASANADGSFRIEGSFAPLFLFVGVFVVRYVVNVALAVDPALASNAVAGTIAALAYGLPSGLLIARSRKTGATRGARSADAGALRA